MPLWLTLSILALAVAGLALAVWSLRGDRARGRRRCPSCWYDLAGAGSLRCSECGRTAASERVLLRTRRRWRWAGLALVLVLVAAGIGPIHAVWTHGWKAVPATVLIVVAPWQSLDVSLPGGGSNEFVQAFSPAVQKPLPRWQQGLLARSLLSCLRDPDPKQRGLAAAYTAMSGAGFGNDVLDSCIPALVAAMDDPDPDAASMAANAVARLCAGDGSLFPTWTRLLGSSPHEQVRTTAAVMLGALGPEGDHRVILPLLVSLTDPSQGVVAQAIYGLGRTRDPTVVPALSLFACSKDYGVSAAACHALGQLESAAAPAVPSLLGIVRDIGNNSRGWAIIALGRIGPGAIEATGDLRACLLSTSARARVREESAIALGRIGDGGAEIIAALRAGLDQPNVPIQLGCLEGLFRLGWVAEGDERGKVEAFASGSNAVCRVWARVILARMDGALDAEVEELIGLFNGQPWTVSVAAINAVEAIGPRASRALPALREICVPRGRKGEGPDADLKRQAAEPAIRRIAGGGGGAGR